MVTSKINFYLIFRIMAIYVFLIGFIMFLSNSKTIHIFMFILTVIIYDVISKLNFLLLSISVRNDSVTIKYIRKFRLETRVLSIKEVQLIIRRNHIARTLFGNILVVKINGENFGKIVLGTSGWTKELIMKINNSMALSKESTVKMEI